MIDKNNISFNDFFHYGWRSKAFKLGAAMTGLGVASEVTGIIIDNGIPVIGGLAVGGAGVLTMVVAGTRELGKEI